MSAADSLLAEIVRENVATYREGLTAGMAVEGRKIAAILFAYDKALADSAAKIPTYLHAAIEAARPLTEEDKANRYADAMLESDRLLPRAEHDTTTTGTPLKAGT